MGRGPRKPEVVMTGKKKRNQQSVPCDYCGRTFRSNVSMEKHKVKHAEEEQVQIEIQKLMLTGRGNSLV